MTTGVWQLALIVGVICYLVSPIVLANRTKRLGRRDFAIRSVGIFAVFLVGNFMVAAENAAIVLTGAFGILAGLPLYLIWSVHRAQDAGLSKWLNLIQLIPLVGLGLWVLLLVKKTDEPPANVIDVFD